MEELVATIKSGQHVAAEVCGTIMNAERRGEIIVVFEFHPEGGGACSWGRLCEVVIDAMGPIDPKHRMEVELGFFVMVRVNGYAKKMRR